MYNKKFSEEKVKEKLKELKKILVYPSDPIEAKKVQRTVFGISDIVMFLGSQSGITDIGHAAAVSRMESEGYKILKTGNLDKGQKMIAAAGIMAKDLAKKREYVSQLSFEKNRIMDLMNKVNQPETGPVTYEANMKGEI